MRSPASNSGTAAAGPTDQKRLGARVQLEERMLSYPAEPVSENTGNQAARATPIRLLAAAIARSALPTSGRRCSSVEGNPASKGGGALARVPLSSVNAEGTSPRSTAI